MVGAGLAVDGDKPEGGDGEVCDGCEEGVPDVEDEQYGFDEEDEG